MEYRAYYASFCVLITFQTCIKEKVYTAVLIYILYEIYFVKLFCVVLLNTFAGSIVKGIERKDQINRRTNYKLESGFVFSLPIYEMSWNNDITV